MYPVTFQARESGELEIGMETSSLAFIYLFIYLAKVRRRFVKPGCAAGGPGAAARAFCESSLLPHMKQAALFKYTHTHCPALDVRSWRMRLTPPPHRLHVLLNIYNSLHFLNCLEKVTTQSLNHRETAGWAPKIV